MFNNMDPETYTINFWSDYFQINPSTIRNVVNYIAYPIFDQKTKKIVEILYFKDTQLAANANLFPTLDRQTYLEYLETDYYNRVVEEYGEESGIFGRVDAPKWHTSSDKKLELSDYLGN